MAMPGYTKLFNSILASTIWLEDDQTRIVWIAMLAMADKNGVVEAAMPGLANIARVSQKACKAALEKLQGPDPHSRSQEHEGRRIAAIDGGWQVLNHPKYRAKMGQDERREYNRIRQRAYRAGVTPASTDVANVNDASHDVDNVAHAEAEADTKAKESLKTLPQSEPSPVCGNVENSNLKAPSTFQNQEKQIKDAQRELARDPNSEGAKRAFDEAVAQIKQLAAKKAMPR